MTVNTKDRTCSEDDPKYQKHINEKAELTDIVNQIYISPCSNACPAGINIPGFISLIAADRKADAYTLIKRNNPFPYTCGLICPHPCEDQCRRAEIEKDKSVNICNLKSTAADYVMNSSEIPDDPKRSPNGKKVGIIGGGPSGLTCAYYLAKLGYDTTVYEKDPVAGGMASTGIPQYRAAMDIVQWEVQKIAEVGVKIVTGTEVGKDVLFDDLAKKNNAIFIAGGMSKGTYIGLEGEHAKEVYQAVDFLSDTKLNLYNSKKLPPIGKRVVIIGGGNVAVDVVRSVKRMGAKEVTLVCLEQRDEMPAWEHEVNACVDEDIDVNNGWGPKKIITDKDNHVKGIIFKQCVEVFDENGRFSPKYHEDELVEYKADTIIMAIGQSPNIDFLTKKFLKDPEDEKSKGIELFRGKWIVANSENLTTGNAAIFAGGDIIKPGLMVEAIGHGRRAAQAIDQYLGGTGELFTDHGIKIPIPPIDSSTWKYERNDIEQIDIDERVTSFMDEAKILTPDISRIESFRCMGCDIMQFDMLKCIGCGTCVKNCPNKAISFVSWEKDYVFGTRTIRKARVDPKLCECCGICLSECPVNAISSANWGDQSYFDEIETLANKS